MPNGLGAILAALAGGAKSYTNLKQREREEALEAERRAREEARNARIELRQQQQDARALAMDEIQLRQYGATVVDPNIASGKAQRDVTRGMDIAQDIMGSQSAISTPQPDQSPAKTARLGLTLAPVGLPSKYDPQEQLSQILKGKQADRSAMDETMRNSVQLGNTRYRIPSIAEGKAVADAQTRKELIEEGRGIADGFGLREISDAQAIAFAKNPNLAQFRADAMRATEKKSQVTSLVERVRAGGPDGKKAELELLAEYPSVHFALFGGTGNSNKAFTQLNQQVAAARANLDADLRRIPRPSVVGKMILDMTPGSVAFKNNPAYAKAVADSLAFEKYTLGPQRLRLEKLTDKLLGTASEEGDDMESWMETWTTNNPQRKQVGNMLGETVEQWRQRGNAAYAQWLKGRP